MANEPLTPEMEKEIRDWLALQDSLYIKGGVWHGRKREDHHIRAAAMVAEIDRLREELSIVEQENSEVRAGAERECDRLRAARDNALPKIELVLEELSSVPQDVLRHAWIRLLEESRAVLNHDGC